MKYTLRYLDRDKWVRVEVPIEADTDAKARIAVAKELKGKNYTNPILFLDEGQGETG